MAVANRPSWSSGVPPERPWISTFHSLCARLLRREAVHAGLAKDFAIYDDDDQLPAVKLAMGKLRIEDDALTPRNVLSRISYAKNQGQMPEQVRAEGFGWTREAADITAGDESWPKQSNAVDFDDLLLRTAKVLRESAVVREKWQRRFQYLHVDEYQDTKRVHKMELWDLFMNENKNGWWWEMDDQSIYRWRGADGA